MPRRSEGNPAKKYCGIQHCAWCATRLVAPSDKHLAPISRAYLEYLSLAVYEGRVGKPTTHATHADETRTRLGEQKTHPMGFGDGMEELVLTVCKHVYHVTIAHMKRVLWLSVLRPLFSRRRALSSLNALQVEAAHLAERDHGLLERPLGAMIRVAAVPHTAVTHKQQSGTHSFRVASKNDLYIFFQVGGVGYK